MLDKKDKFRLRGLSNPLKPVVIIGKDGLSFNALNSINDVLNTQELIKISVLKTFTGMDIKELASLIESSTDSTLINTIGRVIVIYKKNKDINKYDVK